MANQEHLNIFKLGVETWNQWRKEHQGLEPDLSFAHLSGADLRGADLDQTDLSGANLSKANLKYASLSGADLSKANLSGAELEGAHLVETDLIGTDLRGADLDQIGLFGANLSKANLSKASLSGADLSRANVSEANFSEVNLEFVHFSNAALSGANFRQALVGWTIFVDNDLSMVKGLETMEHNGPSSIGIDTIIRSQGKIPEIFLRKAGVPPSIIEAIPSLLGSLNPLDFYSCFISYSSKDQDFAERLYADLQSKGVRCWFAPEDMKTGDEIRSRIDEAIRIHDKLLLVLSEQSVESTWVKKEVETAFEKEDQQKRLVLFPIKLDDTVMKTSRAWAADIRRMRHISDFTCWKNHDEYQKAFNRLLRDLKTEAQKMGS